MEDFQQGKENEAGVEQKTGEGRPKGKLEGVKATTVRGVA